MNERFSIAAAFVLAPRIEGGYVDDPDDPGGPTKHGISLRFLKGVIPYATTVTIWDLSPETATDLYREHFWDDCKCDALPPGIDLAVFDGAVNQGPRTARKLLQRALGVEADGYFGPVTLQAVLEADLIDTLTDFLARRAKRYAETANFQRYGRGWMTRLFEVQRAAIAPLELQN